ncbi:MAG: pyruvate kinase [Bacteroidia bacterium]|nr:pyruvate kinase [Bacteroidia bacterium]
MKSITELQQDLQKLRQKMRVAEIKKSDWLEKVLPENQKSAKNLIDYLAFRSESLQLIQESLHFYGYSSLASSESHISVQLDNLLALMDGIKYNENALEALEGAKRLSANTEKLFGNNKSVNIPFIMVTLEGESAVVYKNIVELLKNGMNVARINCAHDNEHVWLKMVENVRKASQKTGNPCSIYMDLAGPKIRTQVVGKGAGKGKFKIRPDEEFLLIEAPEEPSESKKTLQCTLPGIVNNLKNGHRVLFDDGLFEAVVVHKKKNVAHLKMIRISANKPFVRAEKGMNFPDTVFHTSALTQYDMSCLPFITANADMLGASFVNHAADIEELQKQLAVLGKPVFPVIAKIETNEAVNNLPFIILQGMKKGTFGVMIARGDLAVEIGFERLSEIQEEILWICEAAHIPVIWATQVLENLNKQGVATRSEATDAAHAALAECVMINKGEHTLEVLKTLIDILRRSRQHNYKQRHIFRELSIARRFFSNA